MNLTLVQEASANQIAGLVRTFFSKFPPSCSSNQNGMSEPRVRGVFAELRPKIIASQNSHLRIELYSEPVWNKIGAKVFRITAIDLHNSVAIIAIDDNQKILWLDNHADDDDFSDFVRREKLQEWLGQAQDELVELLLSSKCYFLGQPEPPHLIRQVEDIPLPSEEDFILVDEVVGKTRREIESGKRAGIAQLIHPPQYSKLTNGKESLDFCIWTRILGRVFDLQCVFDRTARFLLKGKLLDEGLGKAFAPR